MKQIYSIEWLIQKVNTGELIDYLFFWGHTNKQNKAAGKFCFSQWYPSPFIVEGIEYKTAEHWMMARKALLFGDTASFEKIISSNEPAMVKKLGRTVTGFDEEAWNEKRYGIVRLGNIHKFNQHPAFANYLLNTGAKVMVEASPADAIWGIGLSQEGKDANNPYAWRGLNLLGFALMEVREFLAAFGHFSEIEKPFLLPWKKYPGISPLDLFWRMGKGEELITDFSKFYSALSSREKAIIALTNPAPPEWNEFYEYESF